MNFWIVVWCMLGLDEMIMWFLKFFGCTSLVMVVKLWGLWMLVFLNFMLLFGYLVIVLVSVCLLVLVYDRCSCSILGIEFGFLLVSCVLFVNLVNRLLIFFSGVLMVIILLVSLLVFLVLIGLVVVIRIGGVCLGMVYSCVVFILKNWLLCLMFLFLREVVNSLVMSLIVFYMCSECLFVFG